MASATAACGAADRWQHAVALVCGSSRRGLRANLPCTQSCAGLTAAVYSLGPQLFLRLSLRIACNAAASACEKPGRPGRF